MHFSNMSRERFSLFGLFLLMTISDSLPICNTSKVGESVKYQSYFNASGVDLLGASLSVWTPDRGQKIEDLLRLAPGDTKDSSSCTKSKDPLLGDCCQKNLKEGYLHKRKEGSFKFCVVTKHGPISSCGNYTIFIMSTNTMQLSSSKDICIIISNGTAESPSANPLFTSTTPNNKTEGVTATDSDSSLSLGTANHGVTATDSDSSLSPGTANHAAAGTSWYQLIGLFIISFFLF